MAGITGINCKLTIEDAPQPDILAYEIEESESADLKLFWMICRFYQVTDNHKKHV